MVPDEYLSSPSRRASRYLPLRCSVNGCGRLTDPGSDTLGWVQPVFQALGIASPDRGWFTESEPGEEIGEEIGASGHDPIDPPLEEDRKSVVEGKGDKA